MNSIYKIVEAPRRNFHATYAGEHDDLLDVVANLKETQAVQVELGGRNPNSTRSFLYRLWRKRGDIRTIHTKTAKDGTFIVWLVSPRPKLVP